MESTGTEKKKTVLSTHSDVEISASVTKTSTTVQVQHLGDHKFPSNAEKQEKCDTNEENSCQEKSENKLLVVHQLPNSEIEAKSDVTQWSNLTENNDHVKGTYSDLNLRNFQM